jgi:hypothetical protein
LFILSGAGPTTPSLNEFNPLFNRNRFGLLASGVWGKNDTLGDELVHTGLWGRLSYSVGQFHHETEGFRENNDLEEDIYNVFAQVSLSNKTSIQGEFRYTDTQKGDLPLRFDPDDFLPTLRQGERTRSIRLGFHHAFPLHSDLIASVIYKDADFDTEFETSFTIPLPPPIPPIEVQQDFDLATDEDGFMAEVQHLFRWGQLHLTSGVGHVSGDRKNVMTMTTVSPPPPSSSITVQETDIRHTNLYLYSLINYPKNITWTLGGSGDFFEDTVDRDQFNPKFGVTWSPFSATTLRAAVFRVLKRTLISNQTIEPTQVAGFNQFFDDGEGTESWRYGIGIDQKLFSAFFGGLELSQRDLEVPFLDLPSMQVREADWEERLGRLYFYWTPHPWLATSGEYQYERLERDPEFVGAELFTKITTHRLPLGISFFHPWGFSARLKATYVDQEGEFGDPVGGVVVRGDDHFWVFDASIEARNLFDEEFKFQDTDPSNPVIYPERFIFARFTLAF